VQDVLHNPITVQIGRSAPATTVSHAIYPVNQHLKTALLIEVLRNTETESVVVFTRTKRRTERVTLQLQRAGFRANSLQGDLSQGRRQAAIDGFRSGLFKILVATDIAARGIDVLSISHVINYDMPESADAYTHRIGRTGRVDKNGDALTFVTSEDTAMIRELEVILKAKLERRTLQGFDYTKPAPANMSMGRPRQIRQRIGAR
jgi:ATP-dependent RNA helicase RhlE